MFNCHFKTDAKTYTNTQIEPLVCMNLGLSLLSCNGKHTKTLKSEMMIKEELFEWAGGGRGRGGL